MEKNITDDDKLERLYKNVENSLINWYKLKQYDLFDQKNYFYLGEYLLSNYPKDVLAEYGITYDCDEFREYEIGTSAFFNLKEFYGRYLNNNQYKIIYEKK